MKMKGVTLLHTWHGEGDEGAWKHQGCVLKFGLWCLSLMPTPQSNFTHGFLVFFLQIKVEDNWEVTVCWFKKKKKT